MLKSEKFSIVENFEGTSLGAFIRGLALSNLSDKTVGDMIYWGTTVSVYCTKMKDLCRARYTYWKAIKDFFVNEPNKSIQSFKGLRSDKIQKYIVQFYFMVHRNSKDFSLTQLFTLKFDNDNNKYDYILNSYLEFAVSDYQKIDTETIVYQIQQILNEKVIRLILYFFNCYLNLFFFFKKSVRIFLDNGGTDFKTLVVTEDCTMYELVEMMREKIFTDTTGFGIWEVRDKLGKYRKSDLLFIQNNNLFFLFRCSTY